MNEKEPEARIKYVKPRVFDLGSVTVVQGATCNPGGTADGTPGICQVGPGATTSDCRTGNGATGGQCNVGNGAHG